jgi:hypothetical protein
MGAYGHWLGARLKLNQSQPRLFRSGDQFATADSGLFLVLARGNFRLGSKRATGPAAEYYPAADIQSVWKPNANDIRGTLSQLGRRASFLVRRLGGRQGWGRVAGSDRAMIFGFGE